MKKSDERRFLELVQGVNSEHGGTRVVARLNMRSFIDKHGKEECDKLFAKHFPKG